MSAQIAGTPRKRGRPKGTGTRAAEALRRIEQSPGIVVNDLAAQMDLNPNYLYRVLPALALDGKLRKEGKGYYVTEQASAKDELPGA